MSARIKTSVILLSALLAQPVAAQTGFSLAAPGADPALAELLRGVSLTRGAVADETADAQDIFAAAQADYARMVGVLYDQGHYGGTVTILLDGREAAMIAPMDAPGQIGTVAIRVDPGPVFRFSRASVAPTAPKTILPAGFAVPEVARSGVIAMAAQTGISAWRDAGHAKAGVARQSLVADHRLQTLDADIVLRPGPVATFGTLHMSGAERLRRNRLAKIAGFPAGERFSPEALEQVRNRLRRTGIFSAVTLTEAETLRKGTVLDANLSVVEAKPRRLGLGAEVSTANGMMLSGYWLHRNLLGGGERFRLDAEVSGIGASSGGTDTSLAARLDRPATFSPDTAAFVETGLTRKHEEDYRQRGFTFGFGLSHIFTPRLSAEVGLGYEWSQISESSGETIFRQVTVPLALIWDNRDTPADATRGYYGKLDLMPFYGLGTTGSGARLQGDFRAYRGFGTGGRFVLAGRAQIGGVFGPKLGETPRDYLFYAGGGGTVRGHPYQSLGVTVLKLGTQHSGGSRFLALSTEIRAGVTEKIGAVAFYDAAFVGADGFLDTGGDWISGAGLGLRYKTPIGPIRFDVAAPLHGSKDDGVQIYLGIGQAF